MPPKIQIQSVSKRYPAHDVHALNQVSLDVKKGELVTLMGQSGCGKSTLLNLIGGIDRPSEGNILLDGTDIASLCDKKLTLLRRERVGFVFQFFNLLNTLTVAENTALPLELAGASSANERAQKVQEILGQVGLAERADFYPSQLSGGQMQRVAIARALIHQPDILLADEPTGNLDSENGENILTLLVSLCGQNGQTLLMATHSPEAANHTDRIIHLRDGQIISDSPVNTIETASIG